MIEEYKDFEIRIRTGRNGTYPVEVDSPAGEASGTLHLPFDVQELDEIMERVQTFDTDQDFLKEVGGRLYAALFVGPIKTLLAESQGMCGEKKGLRLRLRIGPPELAVLPWEFLYDEEKEKFLALLPQTILTRHIAVPEPMRSLKAQQIRLLVAIASPKRLPPLKAEKEKQHLLEALAPLIEQNLAQVEFLEGATMSRLMDKLREKFNVLHFIGHGDLDGETGQGHLCFEDEWGGTNLVDGQTLGHLLENTNVRLVTLNACESAQLTGREARLSMAPALLAAGVPAVVAMQSEIPDETAVIFAREFYRSLAFNRPVGAALAEARNVIQCTLGIDNVDWAIPVLYDRSVDGCILDLQRPRTWREVWLMPPRMIAVAVGIVAFVAILLSAIPGFQSLVPTPSPIVMPSPTSTPSPTITPSPTVTPSPTITPSPTPTPPPTPTPLAFPAAAESEILVIVVRFDRRGGPEFDASQRIFDRLQEILQTDTVARPPRVERIDRVLADPDTARQLGEVYNATMVIWGWYDDIGISPNYEVTTKAGEVEKVELGEAGPLPSQPASFAFYIREDLPYEMTYLSSFTIGQVYYYRQEWEAALDFANLAMNNIQQEKLPGLENLYLLRGNIHYQQRKHEQARADFDQAIKANPEYAHAYVGRAAADISLDQAEAALADLARAIELDNSIPSAYYNRGLANLMLGEFDEAIPDLDQAIALDPAHTNTYWVRGFAYYMAGDMDRAMADYDHLVSMAPDSAVGYAARGNLYIRAGEYDKAEANLSKALEINPDHLEANADMGWLHFYQQKLTAAIKFSEKAIAIGPHRRDVRFILAACLLAGGETERAFTEYRRAIDMKTPPQAARDAIADLEWLRGVQPDTPGLDQMIQEIQASLEKLE